MITEAQLFVERSCQLSCPGCYVVRGKASQIKAMGNWPDTAIRFRQLGIKTVKILGGEPTLLPNLVEFVQALTDNGIRSALLSNGIGFDTRQEIYDRCLDAGLTAIIPSIDGKRSPFAKKTQPGWQLLNWGKSRNIPLRVANVVILKVNLGEVLGVVEELVADGVRVNLCVVNYLAEGEDQKDFLYRMSVADGFKLNEEKNKEETLNRFHELLGQLALYADHIVGGQSYLDMMGIYGFDRNWSCTESNQLRVDADGNIQLCLDRYMENPLHILDAWEWDQYNTLWAEERRQAGHCTCAWSAPMIAQIRSQLEYEDLAPIA